MLRLRGDEAHHAVRVLRLQPGDSTCVLDGAGQRITCVARSVAKSELTLEVVSRESLPAPSVPLSLFCAVPKGGLFEDILEQAIELGVSSITPLITDHGNVRFDAKQAEAKLEKWRSIAIESIKQCGSAWLPRVTSLMTIDEAVGETSRGELSMVADLRPGRSEITSLMKETRASLGRTPRGMSLWVGPEGDFSPRELALLRDAEVLSITLGPRVLRCATAAVSALAIVSQDLRVQSEESGSGLPMEPITKIPGLPDYFRGVF